MLKGIITLLVFQFIGESITALFSLLIPGPVIGMVLLLIFLLIRKSSFESLDNTVNFFLKYLPLLFIPAAMGVITQFDVLSREFLPIFLATFVGTLIALAFTAKLMDFISIKKGHYDEL